MPYITQKRRDVFDEDVDRIVGNLSMDRDKSKGELNYIIFSIVKRHIDDMGMSYANAQDFICGTLTACQMELYRRILVPYEEGKLVENGDV